MCVSFMLFVYSPSGTGILSGHADGTIVRYLFEEDGSDLSKVDCEKYWCNARVNICGVNYRAPFVAIPVLHTDLFGQTHLFLLLDVIRKSQCMHFQVGLFDMWLGMGKLNLQCSTGKLTSFFHIT